MFMDSASELLAQPVGHHDDAVEQVQLLWVHWMRMLDEPIFSIAAPGFRSSDKAVRGLIEMDPKNLSTSISVIQSPQSAQQLTVLRQQGIEMLQAGRIDEYEYYENYDLAADPEESIVRATAQRVSDIVIFGNTDNVDPGALITDIVEAVRGTLSFEMLNRSPGFSLASAQQMASTAAQAAAGNVAAPDGIRRPGMGLGTDLPGEPTDQAPPVV